TGTCMAGDVVGCRDRHTARGLSSAPIPIPSVLVRSLGGDSSTTWRDFVGRDQGMGILGLGHPGTGRTRIAGRARAGAVRRYTAWRRWSLDACISARQPVGAHPAFQFGDVMGAPRLGDRLAVAKPALLSEAGGCVFWPETCASRGRLARGFLLTTTTWVAS